jgi:DNA-binding response OmpR family regulator
MSITPAMRLILVEDNERLTELIGEGLRARGFALDCCTTFRQAKAHFASGHYDLAVVDLGLPDGDGLHLIRLLRSQGQSVPIIVITSRDALGERVLGLDSGADDYLVKPFQIEELAARCRALLRRPGHCLGAMLQAGNLSLDVGSRQVSVAGTVIDMPPRETALLEQLMRHVGQVVPRPVIDASLYALSKEVSPNAVEAAVSRLRKRLTAAGATVQIHTAHGIGYLLSE